MSILWVLQFSFFQENQQFRFQFDLETADKKSHFLGCLLLNSHSHSISISIPIPNDLFYLVIHPLNNWDEVNLKVSTCISSSMQQNMR